MSEVPMYSTQCVVGLSLRSPHKSLQSDPILENVRARQTFVDTDTVDMQGYRDTWHIRNNPPPRTLH
jgi:hypothetical protein